jgi:hypothetical protein
MQGNATLVKARTGPWEPIRATSREFHDWGVDWMYSRPRSGDEECVPCANGHPPIARKLRTVHGILGSGGF